MFTKYTPNIFNCILFNQRERLKMINPAVQLFVYLRIIQYTENIMSLGSFYCGCVLFFKYKNHELTILVKIIISRDRI